MHPCCNTTVPLHKTKEQLLVGNAYIHTQNLAIEMIKHRNKFQHICVGLFNGTYSMHYSLFNYAFSP
jgi:hypothetical protein